MKKKSKIRDLLSLFLMLPLSSYGANLLNKEAIASNDYIELLPNESLNLFINDKEVIISHKFIQQIVGPRLNIDQEQPIGIKFHEESNTLDFSFIDGISHIVTLEKVTGTPPNGII